jgi:threonine synthase
MKYIYTDDTQPTSTLKEAMTNSMPSPNGLWLPEKFPKLLLNDSKKSFHDIIFMVLRALLSDEISDSVLRTIIKESFNFSIPLVHLHDNIHILELFHGPTMTFKDVGARFMARIIRHLIPNKTINVVAATSGDTGGAVADAFSLLPNVNINIFYPSGLISSVQEKQITSYGKNVKAYSVDGNFDDCQSIVKQLLRDKIILSESFIFPANSINIIRLIPQVSYYFWAYAQLNMNGPVNFCVPSGNLGNITAGVIAYLMGLPVHKFIVATNINKTFGTYLNSGIIPDVKAIPSLSCAMDISIPNNLIRLKYMFKDHIHMQSKINSYSITDDETLHTISTVHKKYNYILDPHTSVGYTSIDKYNSQHIQNVNYLTPTILLSTAHPAKFPEVLKKAHLYPTIPNQLRRFLTTTSHKININKSYSLWRNIIGKNITLIGMPGAGKTTIGKQLSSNMNKIFIDTDDMIEHQYDKKLHEIIKQKGNNAFLNIEEDTILNLQCSNTIISTGGSVIYSEKAMDYLQKISTIIYLDVPLSTLCNRLNNLTERGVILKHNQTFEDLFNERIILYKQYSHIIITDTSLSNIINTYIKYKH